jgi:hypothetical protein
VRKTPKKLRKSLAISEIITTFASAKSREHQAFGLIGIFGEFNKLSLLTLGQMNKFFGAHLIGELAE